MASTIAHDINIHPRQQHVIQLLSDAPPIPPIHEALNPPAHSFSSRLFHWPSFDKISHSKTILLGGLISLGVYALFNYQSYQSGERVKRARKRTFKLVNYSFQTNRHDIIAFITQQSWNHLSGLDLNHIYDSFSSYLEHKEHGYLTRAVFTHLHSLIGVHDSRVINSLFRFWDHNHDSHIDFLEFIERLNLICFGSKLQHLDALFDVFDLDSDGAISESEVIELMLSFPRNQTDSPQQQKEHIQNTVRKLFQACDKNKSGRICFNQFLSLADDSSIDLSFNYSFFELFSMNTNMIQRYTQAKHR